MYNNLTNLKKGDIVYGKRFRTVCIYLYRMLQVPVTVKLKSLDNGIEFHEMESNTININDNELVKILYGVL